MSIPDFCCGHVHVKPSATILLRVLYRVPHVDTSMTQSAVQAVAANVCKVSHNLNSRDGRKTLSHQLRPVHRERQQAFDSRLRFWNIFPFLSRVNFVKALVFARASLPRKIRKRLELNTHVRVLESIVRDTSSMDSALRHKNTWPQTSASAAAGPAAPRIAGAASCQTRSSRLCRMNGRQLPAHESRNDFRTRKPGWKADLKVSQSAPA